MTPPRRTQTTLGLLCAILLGGVFGLMYWGWRRRSGFQPGRRYRRARALVLVPLLLVIAVGTVWRTTVAAERVAACSPPGGTRTVMPRERLNAALFTEEAATWPETGIGLLYARDVDAKVCLSSQSDYYVAVPADVVETSATTMGDVVLSPRFDNPRERMMVASHEARHRTQWAITTAVGGPFLFPVAYAVDDFFFPGSRNQFERLAGLKEGKYEDEGIGPVLGPAQIAVLSGLGAVVVLAVIRTVRRRRSSSSAGRSE